MTTMWFSDEKDKSGGSGSARSMCCGGSGRNEDQLCSATQCGGPQVVGGGSGGAGSDGEGAQRWVDARLGFAPFARAPCAPRAPPPASRSADPEHRRSRAAPAARWACSRFSTPRTSSRSLHTTPRAPCHSTVRWRLASRLSPVGRAVPLPGHPCEEDCHPTPCYI